MILPRAGKGEIDVIAQLDVIGQSSLAVTLLVCTTVPRSMFCSTASLVVFIQYRILKDSMLRKFWYIV